METLRQKIDAARLQDGKDEANAKTALARMRAHSRQERIREENRILWAAYYWQMASTHTAIASEYLEKAAQLEKEDRYR